MAGGSGTRFWPLSRRRLPKQCLSLDGGPSLLRATVDRLLPIVPADRIAIVTGADMVEPVCAERGPVALHNVLVEPTARNTLPCVAWAASVAEAEGDVDDVIIVLPADHHVADGPAFREALLAGIAAAEEHAAIVTIGITPNRPDTGFGYIEQGASVTQCLGHAVRQAAAFREKPRLADAEAWVDAGTHLWNAGIFIARVQVLLDAIAQHQPRTRAALRGAGRQLHPDAWGQTEATSVDYGLMERHPDVLCVPASFGWSDVGSWIGAGPLLPAVEGGRGRVAGAVAVDAEDNVLWAPDKVVALVGVRGIVVVDTPDAILVMDAARAQDLRLVLERLQRERSART